MKTKLFILIAILMFSVSFSLSAHAVSIPLQAGTSNTFTDDSAEYLLNWNGGDQANLLSYTTDDGNTTLDFGDRLRGAFILDKIKQPSFATETNLGSAGIEVTGLFDVEVTSKVATGNTVTIGGSSFATFDYFFGPTPTFEATYGTGAMLAIYVDNLGDGDDFNRASILTDDPPPAGQGNILEETLLANAQTGDHVYSFGFEAAQIAGTVTPIAEGWGTGLNGAPADVSAFSLIDSNTGAGTALLRLNLLTNVSGLPLDRVIGSVFGATLVDFGATIGLVGIQNPGTSPPTITTPFDAFNNADGGVHPSAHVIPEPSMMFLFGSGLIMLAGLGRRRLSKK